jgi:hypothetical protein
LAEDLEQKRGKGARKEFETYKARTFRKIKGTRLEVLRAGFGAEWASKDYGTTISIANKLLQATPQEDDKLLLWYGQALTRKVANV